MVSFLDVISHQQCLINKPGGGNGGAAAHGAAVAHLFVLVLLAFLPVLGGCSIEGAWDSFDRATGAYSTAKGWTRRIKLTMDNTGQAETLNGFPVLVKLTPGRFDYGAARPDGGDIRFLGSDGETKLPYEIERWVDGGESIVWVKVPTVAASSGSDFFWLYYANPTAGDEQNRSAVWSNGYVGVWHLGETGSGADEEYRDSSPYGNHGTGGVGFLTVPVRVAGVCGHAQGLDGSHDGISVRSAPSIDDLGPVTYSYWIRDDGYDNGDRIISKGPRRLWAAASELLKFEVDYSVTPLLKERSGAWTPGVWRLITVTWNGSDFHAGVTFYGDGAPIGDSNRADGAGAQNSDAGIRMVLGNVHWPAADRSWDGAMDEIRISNVVRSPAWIAAQHLSMTDSFLTFGPEQTVE